VTININAELFEFCNWNENNLNPLTRINWRASLVPAAAVIPAPIAYIKVVAVKKLVVEFLGNVFDPWFNFCAIVYRFNVAHLSSECYWHLVVGSRSCFVYCEKIRVFKAGVTP
jgi:hypothetical protein